MSSADEYHKNAEVMMRRALTARDQEERQDCLRMAGAWATLAQSTQEFAVKYPDLIAFAEQQSNPLANESDF